MTYIIRARFNGFASKDVKQGIKESNEVFVNSKIDAEMVIGEPPHVIYNCVPGVYQVENFPNKPGICSIDNPHWTAILHELGHSLMALHNEAHQPPWGKYKAGDHPPQSAERSIMHRGSENAAFGKWFSNSCADRFWRMLPGYVGGATKPPDEPQPRNGIAALTPLLVR